VVVFTSVVPLDTKETPYPVFFFASYASWVLFQATLILMPRAIIWLRSLMRRTYFPKLLIPLASIGPPLLEWLVSITCFVLVVLYFRATSGSWPINFGWELAAFPLATLTALLFAIAIGTILSVVAVFVRDIVYTAPYLMQILLLVTPIMYPIHVISDDFQWILYVFNPMASIVELTRWSLTGAGHPQWFYFCVSSIIVLSSLIVAIWFFIKAEPYISDES
jgi:lipopolysaccharide transport system permease protein